jgi:hypothetical protein
VGGAPDGLAVEFRSADAEHDAACPFHVPEPVAADLAVPLTFASTHPGQQHGPAVIATRVGVQLAVPQQIVDAQPKPELESQLDELTAGW